MTDCEERTGLKLLGHFCPLMRYPARVIPIMVDSLGELVAVFIDHGLAQVRPVGDDTRFERHENKVKEALAGFDCYHHGLFAVSRHDIRSYSLTDGPKFFSRLLADPFFSKDAAFVRLSLAKEFGTPESIRRELAACANQLQPRSAAFTAKWYDLERGRILANWQQRNISGTLPDSVNEFFPRPREERETRTKSPGWKENWGLVWEWACETFRKSGSKEAYLHFGSSERRVQRGEAWHWLRLEISGQLIKPPTSETIEDPDVFFQKCFDLAKSDRKSVV